MLTSTDCFSFNGKTAHDQYQKHGRNGWILGNSALLSKEQQHSLEDTVFSRRSAFAYSMEELSRYNGCMSEFTLTLDTTKVIVAPLAVQPPRRYRPSGSLNARRDIALTSRELRSPYYPCNLIGKPARMLHPGTINDASPSPSLTARTPQYNYDSNQDESPSAGESEVMLGWLPHSTAAKGMDAACCHLAMILVT